MPKVSKSGKPVGYSKKMMGGMKMTKKAKGMLKDGYKKGK
jgi:hypothetical protein